MRPDVWPNVICEFEVMFEDVSSPFAFFNSLSGKRKRTGLSDGCRGESFYLA